MKIIVRHSEIMLKGGNRPIFENKLKKNIKDSLEKNGIKVNLAKILESRIFIDVEGDKELISDILKKTFGAISFSYVEIVDKDIELIKAEVGNLMKGKKGSIGVNCNRADKTFPLKSPEVKKEVGEMLYDRGFSINLTNPDHRISIDITLNDNVYIDIERIRCYGGLPVGTSGRLLCLFSGGMDSIIAAWMAMKRGCSVDFAHFHSLPENKSVLDSKIIRIIEMLNKWQGKSTIYVIPYPIYQVRTLGDVEEEYDLVLFKHTLLKSAEKLCETKDYLGIITGDAIGQVASQTLENINATGLGVQCTIFRPLICFNKQEIIDKAKELKFFDMGNEDYKDCCSIIAKKPRTKVPLFKMKEILKRIDVDSLIKRLIDEMSIHKIG